MEVISDISKKQLKALTFWADGSPEAGRSGIICDGAIRSGKTLSLTLSFFLWVFQHFEGERFALSGKTIRSLRRNIVEPVLPYLVKMGADIVFRKSEGELIVTYGNRRNLFYLFSGQHEGSAALVQGVTLAGALFDEAALLPESFVSQVLARCSVSGSKFFFTLNPEGTDNWFYREFIAKAEEKNLYRLHFEMADNPSLTPAIIERYKVIYSGSFYRRFVLGVWEGGGGLVYDFFEEETFVVPVPDEEGARHVISCDYGTVNPASFGLWGEADGVWYRIAEYYFDSKREGYRKTDADYVEDIRALAGGREIETIVCDPSARSFIEALRREGYHVTPAKNDVVAGIRVTASLLKGRNIVICEGCSDLLREMRGYRYEEGGERPRKMDDHAVDDMRYFAATIPHAGTDEWIYAKTVLR